MSDDPYWSEADAQAEAARVFGDDWAALSREPSQSRLENYRREIPEVIKGVTQVVVDNPGQMALLLAGGIVIGRAAVNIVRPRTAVEALALAVVLQMGIPVLASAAVRRGWLRIRVRDADGCLVPLEASRDPGADPA